MSRPQTLLSLLVVTVAGIASSIYALDPTFKQLEKEKQLGGRTVFAEQHPPVAVEKAVKEPVAVGEPVTSDPLLEGPPKQSYWSMFKPGGAKVAEKDLSSSDTEYKPS